MMNFRQRVKDTHLKLQSAMSGLLRTNIGDD